MQEGEDGFESGEQESGDDEEVSFDNLYHFVGHFFIPESCIKLWALGHIVTVTQRDSGRVCVQGKGDGLDDEDDEPDEDDEDEDN